MKNKILVFVSIVLLSTFIVACSQSDNSQALSSEEADKLFFRSDNGEGGIQVGVTWIAKKYLESKGKKEVLNQFDLDNQLIFDISMSTHSGDLRTYPILDNAELIVDNERYKAESWELISNDSHHPTGTLIFSAKDKDGEPLIKSDSKVQLNLKELGNIPDRYFIWNTAK